MTGSAERASPANSRPIRATTHAMSATQAQRVCTTTRATPTPARNAPEANILSQEAALASIAQEIPVPPRGVCRSLTAVATQVSQGQMEDNAEGVCLVFTKR